MMGRFLPLDFMSEKCYFGRDMDKKTLLPSEIIDKEVKSIEWDYRDPCGAYSCECWENAKQIMAIKKFLDTSYGKRT